MCTCVTISGGRTKQLDIFCRITGFMSDFLRCIVVVFIRFFHGAIQLIASVVTTTSIILSFSKTG